MLGLTAALYLWQEPKIKPIEKVRLARLKQRADSLVGKTSEEIYYYLITADEKDRNTLMSLKAFFPYPAIKRALSIAFLLSLVFGVAERIVSPKVISSMGLKMSIADISSIILLPIWLFIGYKLWGEFKYMKEVIRRFS
ncbi:MAG: hypothetical protein AAGN15_00545 [Cyanobacteria bacterium J06581_3]